MKRYAVVVAGGSGTRMGAKLPKQFIEIAGYPILMHTLQKFALCQSSVEIILVLAEKEIDTWKKLSAKHNFQISHQIAQGGSTRIHSVKNGLAKIQEEESLVAIHDGVRPLVEPALIEQSYAVAAIHGNAIASVPLKDSIRQVSQTGSQALDRTQYRLIQTPQTFRTSLIRKAYHQLDEQQALTDDASVAEQAGQSIHLIDGDYRNIKITTPEDLLVAQALVAEAN